MSLIDKQHVFDYPMNANLVFQRIMSVAHSIKGLSFNRTEQPYKVILSSGTSMKSWGETVTIMCSYLDETHTRITITSVPVMPTTLVDWGKGKKNINNVLAALQNVLPPMPSTPSNFSVPPVPSNPMTPPTPPTPSNFSAPPVHSNPMTPPTPSTPSAPSTPSMPPPLPNTPPPLP